MWNHLLCPTLFIKTPYFCVGDLGSIPGFGRSHGEGKGYSLQYSGLGNSMDCIVHGVAKSQTWLSDFQFSPSFLLLIKHHALAYSHFSVLFFSWMSSVRVEFHCTKTVQFASEGYFISPSVQWGGGEWKVLVSQLCETLYYVSINYWVFWVKMLPQWLSSKASACNAGDVGDVGLFPA